MTNEKNSESISDKRTIDVSVKLVIVYILIGWSAMIVFPFLTPLLWGLILAITLYPMYTGLLRMVKGRNAIASTIITLLLLCILLVPSVIMITAIVNETMELKQSINNNTLEIPPPNPKVAEWPVVGQKLYDAWNLLDTNLEAAAVKYKDQIISFGQKLMSALRGLFSNIMMFTMSIIIMGVMLAYSETAKKTIDVFMKRLLGDSSEEYTLVISQTVRNVAKGILGVAFIQFAIMGLCFVLAGVPLAGLWALLVFLLALVQLPGAIVAIPVIIYIYSVKEPLPATLWSVLILVAGLSDNVLKPLLMGKGAPVPMIIIFLGAIGGFILSGFIGMFTGAIVLSLSYKLVGLWMYEGKTLPKVPDGSTPQQ